MSMGQAFRFAGIALRLGITGSEQQRAMLAATEFASQFSDTDIQAIAYEAFLEGWATKENPPDSDP